MSPLKLQDSDRKPAPRVFEMVPVSMPDGSLFQSSREKYDAVQTTIIEQFAPRFVPGAVALHLGDTTNKMMASAQPIMKQLGIPLDQHDKLPSVVLWDQKRNWLFLIEAAATHGPMSPKQVIDLNKMLERCAAGLVFVSVFADLDEFTEHLDNIAWKTHAWMAATPDHMLHFNGDRFIGPR